MANQGKHNSFPPQHQPRPGTESRMVPEPRVKGEWYKGSGKLEGKVAIITGADSGIGRSVAIFFAREGADIVCIYNESHEDAAQTKNMVEQEGRKCLLITGNVGESAFCNKAVEQTIKEFGHLDILVNNAAYQKVHKSLEEIPDFELDTTFQTNILSQFYMTRAALKHLKDGAAIINSTSVTAYHGHKELLDYSATKGAIVAFTRSLALNLVSKGIRVNAVAPGPIWTPLIVSSYSPEHVKHFGESTPYQRAGHPEEVAPCYVFLAAHDSSYMTGQVLHPNGGYIVNG